MIFQIMLTTTLNSTKYLLTSLQVCLHRNLAKRPSVFLEKLILVAYKRPTNIHDILVHSKMGKQTASFNVTKCNRKRCSHCSTINESDCFTSTNTASVHKVNYDLSCTSTSVIYLITCKKCKAQYMYVGQTRQNV